MPRILPPPTKYDPLRPVQAKAAAPTMPAVAVPPTRFDPPVQHAGPAGTIQRATNGAAPAARSFAIPPTRYDPGVRHQLPATVVQRAAAAGGGGGGGSGSGGGKPPQKPPQADSKAFYKAAAGKPVYDAHSGAAGAKFDDPAMGKTGQSPSAAAGGKFGQSPSAAAGYRSQSAAAGNFSHRSSGRGRGGRGWRGGSNRPAGGNAAAAAGGAAPATAPKVRVDTKVEAFARTLTQDVAKDYLGKPVALIGTDKAAHSPLYDKLMEARADCLAIWLVHEGGEPHDNDKNIAWLDRCIKAGKNFFVVKPGDHGVGSYAAPMTAAEVKAANPIQTVHEVGYLMYKNYVWDGNNTYSPPK